MNIVLVVSGWPSNKEPARSVFNYNHARSLKDRGYEVKVIFIRAFLPFRKIVETTEEEGITIEKLNIMLPVVRFRVKFWIASLFIKHFYGSDKKNIDIIHGIGGHTAVACCVLSKMVKRKFILHYIGGDINSDFDEFLNSKLFRQAVLDCSFHGFESKALRMIFADRFPQLQNTGVLYRGIDNKRLEYNFSYDNNVIHLLYLGGKPSDGSVKGIYVLIEAILKLNPKYLQRNFVFNLGGPKMPDLSSVQELITNSKIKVKNIGTLGRDEVCEYMFKSHIVIIPSFTEGLPNVLWESMLSGCAVVSSSVGGIPEIIDSGTDGMLFEPGDSERLANIFYDFDLNPGKIEEMAKKARIKVAKFDYTKFITEYENIYKEYTNSSF